MLTSENCIRLCTECPNRAQEGISPYDPPTGDLVAREPRYINARLEFVKDPSETPNIPTQEFGVMFIDHEGNKTSAFLPGVQLEDIAACDRPVVSSKSGFLGRKKHYDCGAQALKLSQLRENLK